MMPTMKQIRDSYIFKVEIIKDFLLIKLFTIVAITWLILQVCLITCLNLIAVDNNYSDFPWIISPLLTLAGILTIAIPFSILIPEVAGLYFNRLRRREKTAEYLDFIEHHFRRKR